MVLYYYFARFCFGFCWYMGRDPSVDGNMVGSAVVWWWGVGGRGLESCEPISSRVRRLGHECPVAKRSRLVRHERAASRSVDRWSRVHLVAGIGVRHGGQETRRWRQAGPERFDFVLRGCRQVHGPVVCPVIVVLLLLSHLLLILLRITFEINFQILNDIVYVLRFGY